MVGICEGLDVEVKSNDYGLNLFGICLRLVFDIVRKASQCPELSILEQSCATGKNETHILY